MKRFVSELRQAFPTGEQVSVPDSVFKDPSIRGCPAPDDVLHMQGFEKALAHEINVLPWEMVNDAVSVTKIPLKQKHPLKGVVIFDLETTGLHPERGDRVIEIGAIKWTQGSRRETFHSLIQTDRHIAKAARSIHGIHPGMLENMPSAKDVFRSFSSFIGQSLLIAHNARFDIGFLRREFCRIGLGLSNPYGCTLRMSRKLCTGLPDYSLVSVYRRLCGEAPREIQPHRALHDAYLTARIWFAMINDKTTNLHKELF